MKVVFAPRAIRDLSMIADYLSDRSPKGAARVQAAILGTLDVLKQFPAAGRRQAEDGVRKIAVGKYPYLIYYLIDTVAEEIQIIAIQHSARRRTFQDQ